jgi:hypothetical protein
MAPAICAPSNITCVPTRSTFSTISTSPCASRSSNSYGEVVSTAFVESTVNQVIAKRFAMKQQMQWTPRGVHLLMQLRTRVLDDTLDNDFKRWCEARQKSEDPLKLAA